MAAPPFLTAEEQELVTAAAEHARREKCEVADRSQPCFGGVVHSFTNKNAGRLNRPEFARYSASAGARSWTSMRELFNEAFA